jgi:hypothetical protein
MMGDATFRIAVAIDDVKSCKTVSTQIQGGDPLNPTDACGRLLPAVRFCLQRLGGPSTLTPCACGGLVFWCLRRFLVVSLAVGVNFDFTDRGHHVMSATFSQ